jgi:hypothetical protein
LDAVAQNPLENPCFDIVRFSPYRGIVNMGSTSDVLEAPLRKMVNRGKKTIETVLTRAGAKRVDSLQTTTNEITYLMGTVRLAIEALGTTADATEKQLHNARLRGLDRIAKLRKAAEPVLETGQVCALMGVSRETIRKKVDRQQILALPKGGDRVFPAFQFKDGDVVPGLAEVLQALDSDSGFVPLSFLLSKNPAFHGESAGDLLQRGEIEPVLAEARNLLGYGG